MRLKQKMALLLTGVMLAGSVGILNPMEVKADPTNNFTLTVPGDTRITQSGWNSIGDVKVEGDIDTSKMVTVEISTTNDSKLTSEGGEEVPYSIKKNNSDKSATDSIDFYAPAVNAKTATSTIGADVSSFSDKPNGTYTGTISFTASLVKAVVKCPREGEKELSSDDLGEASTSFQVGSNWYVAYNGFIPRTAFSSWQNAQDFVAALNAAEYGGYDDWQLLGSEEMAEAWKSQFSSVSRGTVQYLWSPVLGGRGAYCLNFSGGKWQWDSNASTAHHNGCGFVVLRGTSASAEDS